MERYITYSSPVGMLVIGEENGAITHISFGDGAPSKGAVQEETPLLLQAVQQLREYFAGERREFALPLAPKGTPFQQAVWAALQTIPAGETRSYQQIARQVGNEKACRAVGMANNRNPIGIVIPCHRVVGANGTLTGYAAGLDAKRALLALEGAAL